MLDRERDVVLVVPDAHPLIMPVLLTIPMQLLAYHIAVRRGCDVDQPRNLAKSVHRRVGRAVPEGVMTSPVLVVMAAGIGSRYGGLKQVESIGPGGEMLLDYAMFDAIRAGFKRVVFVIRRDVEGDFKRAIGDRFDGQVSVGYACRN